MSGLSAVPGEQPLKVEGASKRNKVAQCGKEYCCTPSLKCGLVWLCCTPLVVLLLLVIIAFSYLDVQAKNPPPLVDAPKAESSTQMEAEFEFGDDGAANAFSTAMADSSSSIYNAMEDAWNSVLEPGRVEEDEGLEVEDARRRGLLESEGRRELTHGSYRKIRAKFRRCRDTCSDESRSKRRSCRSTCRRKLARLMAKLAGDSRDNGAEETLSEAVRIALEEAGHNTTVSVESLSARSSGVYFVCEVDEPFGDAAACGGAVNTVLRNSAEVRDAIASYNEDCEFGDGFPAGYNHNTKKLTLSAVCETKLEEQTFGCRLEQALTARVSEIPKAIETQFGLTTCNIRNPVQCKMGPSLEECAKCGDEKIGADTVRMCLDGEDD